MRQTLDGPLMLALKNDGYEGATDVVTLRVTDLKVLEYTDPADQTMVKQLNRMQRSLICTFCCFVMYCKAQHNPLSDDWTATTFDEFSKF